MANEGLHFVGPFDELPQIEPGPDVIIAEVGQRGDLTQAKIAEAAAGVTKAAALYPKAEFMLLISGYNDDPRKLWEIEEVRDYVSCFVAAIPPPVLQRFTALSLILVGACVGIAKPIGIDPVTGKIRFELQERPH